MKRALIALAITAGTAGIASAQGLVDLVGQASSGSNTGSNAVQVRRRSDQGRLDLTISPAVQALAGEPTQRTVNLGGSLQWNPVCGKFDLKADLHALLGKEAREEYLKGILSAVTADLIGSGTELFCQAQPTACSILMNNNLAANLKLIYSNDICRSIEDAVITGSRRGRAEAIHRCIERKLQEGRTKDDAEQACLRENPEVTGFDGRVVGELDLNQEIKKFISFSDGGAELLGGLTQGRKLGRNAISEDPKPNALAERYDKTREDIRTHLADAIGAMKAGGTSGPTDADLTALLPPGAPPITRPELRLLAQRPASEVNAFLASMSAAAALLKLTREMNEVERKLETLKNTPALEEGGEHTAYLEALIQRIRGERERMLRLYADEERLSGVLALGHSLGEAEVTRNRLDAMRRAAVGEASKNIRLGTRPFGTPESGQSTPARGSGSAKAAAGPSDCPSCGLEYSFGGGGVP